MGTQPVPTMVTPTFSSSASTCTTTRPPAVVTCLAQSLWTSSQVPWTPSVPAHSVSFSAQTTLSSARPELVTTGPRATTPRAPSSSIPSLTLSVRSTQIVSCSPSPSYHRQRCPTPLSSHTTLPFPFTSLSRTPTSACAWTTRPCTTSASVPSSSPPQPTAT